MLHRASSPSPAVTRTRAPRFHNHTTSITQPQPQPPTLPEKICRAPATTNQTGPSNSVPPVLPPMSAPRPPKAGKEGARQDPHYENTIVIRGTKQHVVKNINLEANRAHLTALMRGRDDPGGTVTKPESAAAYENVNVEHITRLTALGFAQDAVIRALGITRNDLKMACDILHEFATKSS